MRDAALMTDRVAETALDVTAVIVEDVREAARVGQVSVQFSNGYGLRLRLGERYG